MTPGALAAIAEQSLFAQAHWALANGPAKIADSPKAVR